MFNTYRTLLQEKLKTTLSLKTKQIAIICTAWNQQETECFSVPHSGDENAGLE